MNNLDNVQNIKNIEVTINCTKSVEILFYHDHHYDVTFNGPESTFGQTKLSTKELVNQLERMKQEIDRVADDSAVKFTYTYQDKKNLSRESHPNTTGKNAKLAFESYLHAHLSQIKDRYLKPYQDLYQAKHKVG